jgi:hypothetical protein
MLYEMVAGRCPFAGESRSDVLAAILDREPAPLARFDPDVPSELQRIVGKALRKDRDERYQDMKDLLLDLQALRDDLAKQAWKGHEETSLPGPTATSAAERLQAYCQRVLDDPRLERYRIDERFVRMRCCSTRGVRRTGPLGRCRHRGARPAGSAGPVGGRAPANAVVVLGPPGAGKVCCCHLQTETARACLADPRRPSRSSSR